MVAELGKPARTRDLQKHHSGTSSSYRTCSPRRKRLALSACLHPPFFFAFEFLYLDITHDLICTLRLFLNQRCGVEGVRKNPRDTPISSLLFLLSLVHVLYGTRRSIDTFHTLLCCKLRTRPIPTTNNTTTVSTVQFSTIHSRVVVYTIFHWSLVAFMRFPRDSS